MPLVPTIHDILQSAQRVAEALKASKPRAELRLVNEEAPSLDETEEEARVVYSMLPLEEPSSVKSLLAAVPPAGPSPYIGVDGSSRKLEAYNLLVGVYSAAVSVVDGAYVVGAYPDTGVYPFIDAGGAAVASLAPDLDLHGLGFVATKPLIDPKSVVSVIDCGGYGKTACNAVAETSYGNGYNVPTMLDENRSFLENRALAYIASRGLSEPGSRVLLDGPVYMTPGLLVQFHRALWGGLRYHSSRVLMQSIYVLSYMLNTLYRAELVEKLRRKGVTVVSVVKRISRSRLLVNAMHSLDPRSELPSTDPQLVERIVTTRLLYASLPLYSYGAALALGPIISVVDLSVIASLLEKALGLEKNYPLAAYNKRVARSGETLAEIIQSMRKRHYIVKRSYYLIVKGALTSYRMYRVEFPQAANEYPVTIGGSGRVEAVTDPGVLKSIIAGDVQVLGEVAWLATHPTQLEAPLPVLLADRVSRTVSKNIALVWFNTLRSHVMFTYETLLEMTS